MGNAGCLVTRVLYTKATELKNFVIVDAGMNDLFRPSLYDAHHAVLPVNRPTGPVIKADIVGPICETGDFLARDRDIARPEQGDLADRHPGRQRLLIRSVGSGIPAGLHNVLRDLQESPLGQKANQLESMTIEMVAMLFDFVFDTKDLPDGIKALLARLQIPVLKAAMLDGAFFAKKSHPARLLVNELAQAGLGWSPVMGQDDPLYRKVDGIVHAVPDRFADDHDHHSHAGHNHPTRANDHRRTSVKQLRAGLP